MQGKNSRWFVVYLAVIFLTCTMGAGSLAIDLGFFQLSIFRALFIGLVCLVPLWSGLSVLTGYRIKINRDYGFYLLFWIIWFFYAFFSVFWAKDVGRWFVATFYVFFGLFFLSLFSIVKFELRTLVLFLTCFVVGATIQSVFAWYEILTADYLFLDNPDRRIRYGLIHAPVVFSHNINDFGTLMLIAFFSCLMVICYWKNRISRIIFSFASVNLAIMIFMSTSRANILALFCGLIFCFLMKFNKWLMLVLTACGAALLGLILVLSALTQTGGSDSIRINLILDGLDFLRETGGFGVGAGQAEWWLMHHSTHAIDNIYNLHNWWFEVLTCYGIVIFIGYLVSYFKIFFTFLNLHTEKKGFDFSSFGCGLLVAFVLACMSSSSLVTCEWLWVVFSLIIAIGNSAKESSRCSSLMEYR